MEDTKVMTPAISSVVIGCLCFGLSMNTANAAPRPVSDATGSCSVSLKQTLYTATFRWKGQGIKARGMRLSIGTATDAGGRQRTIAQISSRAGACYAVCGVRSVEKQGTLSPSSMQLDCKANDFGALSTPATLTWTDFNGPAPSIRFGTWLSGYQRSALKVELDSYSQLTAKPRKLAAAH